MTERVVTQWFTSATLCKDLAMLHSVLFSESLSRGDPRLAPISFDNRELLLRNLRIIVKNYHLSMTDSTINLSTGTFTILSHKVVCTFVCDGC